MARAGRSFMLPVGFCASIFNRILAQPSGTIDPSSINGVLPMRSRMEDGFFGLPVMKLPRADAY
jgi:hypothetical protein